MLKLTMAQLQGYFMLHKDDPEDSLRFVEELFTNRDKLFISKNVAELVRSGDLLSRVLQLQQPDDVRKYQQAFADGSYHKYEKG